LPSDRESQIAEALARAARERTLALHVQPIVALETGGVSGWESLLRFTHPRLGPVPPVEFIPIAESTGSILSLGEWVIDNACSWHTRMDPDQVMGVNISARQLTDRKFVGMVLRTLERYRLEGPALCIELTETTAVGDIDRAGKALDKLRDEGIFVAIDDFGTGQTSLTVLRQLPVSVVKIDRVYVAKAGAGGREDEFLATTISMCNQLGARVVAEGIERPEQLDAVQEYGATWGQGYLLGYPRPVEQIDWAALTITRR
jgi:EAL domain-containing protein (putative c-di-GMP-specific phosphodiesterase class I)